MSFRQFWATIRYNLYLQDSLDIFLQYSPRPHLQPQSRKVKVAEGSYLRLIREIYRSIFWVYVRMTHYQEED